MNLFRLKRALLPLLIFWQTVPPSRAPFSQFRYRRAIISSLAPGQACAILDADVFARAAPALKDLRLYSGLTEVPYTTTVSEPPQQDTDDARVLNLHTGERGQSGRILFGLEMPRRPYTGVVLDLAAHDFIATAAVSGSSSPTGRDSTPLGSFTLFDLTSQHLSRSTTIPLSESAFPYLHIDLALVPAPGTTASSASLNVTSIVKSATVPPSRDAQSLYTVTQAPQPLIQTGHDSVTTFKVPARVPIERIAFTLPPGYKGDFSRAVTIEARGVAKTDVGDISGLSDEDAAGTILRVHKSEAGHDLSAENLTIPVAIGSNMQQPASVELHVEDTSKTPPPLSVQLQMRQRQICFDAASAKSPLMLYYGDASLEAPANGGASLHPTAAEPRMAVLGPETANPAFTASPSPRRLAQRPVLRWIALLGCVCIFALLVIRSTHKRRH